MYSDIFRYIQIYSDLFRYIQIFSDHTQFSTGYFVLLCTVSTRSMGQNTELCVRYVQLQADIQKSLYPDKH